MPTQRNLKDFKRNKSLNIIPVNDRFRNSKEWKKLAKCLAVRYPFCVHPDCDGSTPMNSLHHIKPLFSHPQLGLVIDNIAPICNKHHASVSAFERAGTDVAHLFEKWQTAIRYGLEEHYLEGLRA